MATLGRNEQRLGNGSAPNLEHLGCADASLPARAPRRVDPQRRATGERRPVSPGLADRARTRGGARARPADRQRACRPLDRKSTRLNSSHVAISYAVFCLKKKKVREPQLKHRLDEDIAHPAVL